MTIKNRITKLLPVILYAVIGFLSPKNATVFDRAGLTEIHSSETDKDPSNGFA